MKTFCNSCKKLLVININWDFINRKNRIYKCKDCCKVKIEMIPYSIGVIGENNSVIKPKGSKK